VKTETNDPTRLPDAEFDYIDVSSISNETLTIQETQRLKGKDAPSRARRHVRTNDVLLATVRPTLRRIAIVPEELDEQICSTGCYVLRAKPEVDFRFIFYFLQTEVFMAAMERLQKGASYPAVTDGDVRSQPIPVPSLSEQQRIVEVLDEAFASLATAQAHASQNLQNARALFESHLNAVFTQRGEGWQLRRIPDVCVTFRRGKSRHRPRNEPCLYGGKYPFIQTGDISNADHVITTHTQTYNETGLAQSKLWPKGTVGIAIVGATIGETGVLDFEACFPDSVIGMTVNPAEADPFFLEYMLQHFKEMVKSHGEGSARENINLATFDRLLFPMPSVKEQRQIAAATDALKDQTKRLESIYQRKLAALDELKKSLLHQAFNGEL
jgi:type I restriction enzyme S subunit